MVCVSMMCDSVMHVSMIRESVMHVCMMYNVHIYDL